MEIYHNGTYGDYIMIQILGSWSVDESGLIYTLTSEDDIAATLTVSEDSLTAYYVNKDEDEMELQKPVAEFSPSSTPKPTWTWAAAT